MTEESRRGPYAKGIAKREEILHKALPVIAEAGVHGASVRAIAAAAGLSPAGLLHHFGSKEELFTEVLRKRDEVDSQKHAGLSPEMLAALREGLEIGADIDVEAARRFFVELTAANSATPGMIHLFSQMAVDAVDPEHPAHEFFLHRGRLFQSQFAAVIAGHQATGARAKVDPEIAARMLRALADGLQLQALIEPDLDMAAIADAFFDLIL